MQIKDEKIIHKIISSRFKYESINDMDSEYIINFIEENGLKAIVSFEENNIFESFYLINNLHYKVIKNLNTIGIPPIIFKEIKECI